MKPASSPETEPDFYAMEPCAEKSPDHHLDPKPAPQVIPLSPVCSGSSQTATVDDDEEEEKLQVDEAQEDEGQQEAPASFIMDGIALLPSLPLMETDPPIPVFSLTKTPCMSREPSFAAKAGAASAEADPPVPLFSIPSALCLSRGPSFGAEASAVVSLPSTPLAADMRTISFDPRDDWPDTTFFTHVPSVSDLFHEWTEDRATPSYGNPFPMDCDSEDEAVGLEMNL
jgi:hypothetical protein